MALFEITAAVELLEPTRCAACSSSACSAATDSSSSAPASFRLTSCTSPACPPSPYQKRPSIRWNNDGAIPRSRCSGPSSKIPYASSRACSARLQLPAFAAAARRSIDAAMTSKSAPVAASFHESG